MQPQQREIHHPNIYSQQQCLEACWTQSLSLKFGTNYKTTHRQPQQILHNILHCLNWIQKGVKTPLLLVIIFCIHSLHNLNHVLIFMQITLAFLESVYICIYICICICVCVCVYIYIYTANLNTCSPEGYRRNWF